MARPDEMKRQGSGRLSARFRNAFNRPEPSLGDGAGISLGFNGENEMRRFTLFLLAAVLGSGTLTACSHPTPAGESPAGGQSNSRVDELAKKSKGDIRNLSSAEQDELNTLTAGHAQQAIGAYNHK